MLVNQLHLGDGYIVDLVYIYMYKRLINEYNLESWMASLGLELWSGLHLTTLIFMDIRRFSALEDSLLNFASILYFYFVDFPSLF